MRFVRYLRSGERPHYGWVHDDRVGPVEGDPFNEYHRLEAAHPLDSVTLLPPVRPGKILCAGRNYRAHAEEFGSPVPEEPLLFLKPTTALIGAGETIRLPPQSARVEHEGELVVVIGKRGRRISVDRAADFIFGYTIGNDVTARDLQRADDQWTRAKGFDTFCPLGPWIETELDPADAVLTCRVNGDLKQMASARDMVFDIPRLIAYASSVMTLEPGDLLMTGTPAGVSPLSPGDEVAVTIEGIGTLTNPVAKE